MDVEKLIQAARCCTSGGEGCDECPMNEYIGRCTVARHSLTACKICEISDYYEQKLMLLREDINLLQRTMQTHKDVIADYKRRLEESNLLLKTERSKVIAEVREIINEPYSKTAYGVVGRVDRVLRRLDSMEPAKEDVDALQLGQDDRHTEDSGNRQGIEP